MTREQMQDNVIRKYGFESDETIRFCRNCEGPHNEQYDFILNLEYKLLMGLL